MYNKIIFFCKFIGWLRDRWTKRKSTINLIQRNQENERGYKWVGTSRGNINQVKTVLWFKHNMGRENNLSSPGGEFDTDGGFGFQAKLVPRESGQYVGFPNTRVSDQHDLKQIIVFLIHSIRHFFPRFSNQPYYTNQRLSESEPLYIYICLKLRRDPIQVNNHKNGEKTITLSNEEWRRNQIWQVRRGGISFPFLPIYQFCSVCKTASFDPTVWFVCLSVREKGRKK